VTDWFDDHRQVCEFAYWLNARGYFDGAYDVIRYFESPERWPTWMRTAYESEKVPAL
jgi:hypothetical protein